MPLFRSAKNTFFCLLGCAIGDLGAIYLFQKYHQDHFPEGFPNEYSDLKNVIPSDLWTTVWITAMVSGIVTSVILETFILWKQMGPKEAFRTAVGMSMISMILMEGRNESSGLWDDGGAQDQPFHSACDLRCWFSSCLAL